jgi:serine/threonine protein kinase
MLSSGTIIAEKYKITGILGRGGMGVVYKAEDTKLKRSVALKFLPPELVDFAEVRDRFVLEAQSAAALSHPNICTVYEIAEDDGKTFIAMEFVEGESLRERIRKSPIELEEALEMAIQAAEGLAEAHNKGIVHRDIKSANIMIDEKGQAKVMDFGLAKVAGGTIITKEARTMGTAPYMSPEQASGETVDHRTDIWSLGVVLYEMLSGDLPFKGENEASILYSVVHEEPKYFKDMKADIPPEVEQIISRALKKKLDSRYSSAAEMSEDLKAYLNSLRAPDVGITDFRSFLKFVRKPRIAIPAIIIILAICAGAVWLLNRNAKIRWARNEALPEIIRLVEEDSYTDAFKLAKKAKKYIPDDPLLIEQWEKMSVEISVNTTPTGADVYFRDYNARDSDWEHLGQTPIENVRVHTSFSRLKIEKDEFVTVERTFYPAWLGPLECQLDEKGSIPPEMIRVPGGNYPLMLHRINLGEYVKFGSFLIDRFEVTNKQFNEFVESDGYRNRNYWKHEFKKDGQILSWEEAMTEFRDATGRPGPSTWELGTYPKREDDYPVTGISWYEAAAYAEFAGKSLPSIYHWNLVAKVQRGSHIIPKSNFEGRGVAPVGSYQGICRYGTYDMAGNVKEWCWNETEDMRFILGGAWNEPSYTFTYPDAKFPFDRSASNGFRCMKDLSPGETDAKTLQPITSFSFRDFSKEKPVSDEIFKVYRSLYSYDKTDLNPVIESTDVNSSHWIKEKITFNAAYGNERVIAYLFVPKNSNPPYQTIVYFPGGAALDLRSSEDFPFLKESWKTNISSYNMDFLIKSGRALFYPIYKATYERGDGFNSGNITATSWKEHLIYWSKDFQRSLDYLETRTDIARDKLAYYGLSMGAAIGPILLALENRIKVGVFCAGGFEPWKPPPEVDVINYAPRVKIPILMLNGRYDYGYPLKETISPLLQFLGTPEQHKRLILYESGHYIPYRHKLIKDSLDWLDRYLGPIE